MLVVALGRTGKRRVTGVGIRTERIDTALARLLGSWYVGHLRNWDPPVRNDRGSDEPLVKEMP